MNNQRQVWISTAVLSGLFFLLGWLFAFSWVHRSSISNYWYEASEQKYLTMTGQAGPVTYQVKTSDFASLEKFANTHDEILGVEILRWPDQAAVAFARADSDSILSVRDSDFVKSMRQKFIPMMCH